MTGRPFGGISIWEGPPATSFRVVAEVEPPGRGTWIDVNAGSILPEVKCFLSGEPAAVARALAALAFKPSVDLAGMDKLHFLLHVEATLASGEIRQSTRRLSRRIVLASALIARAVDNPQTTQNKLQFGELPVVLRLVPPASPRATDTQEDFVFDDAQGDFVPLILRP